MVRSRTQSRRTIATSWRLCLFLGGVMLSLAGGGNPLVAEAADSAAQRCAALLEQGDALFSSGKAGGDEAWQLGFAVCQGSEVPATLRVAALVREGKLLGFRGRDGAAEKLEEALRLARRNDLSGKPLVEAYDALAFYWSQRSENGRARKLAENSVEARLEAFGEVSEEYAQGLENLSGYELTEGEGESRGAGAIALIERALEIRRRVYGEASREVIETLQILGEYHRQLGHDAEAERLDELARDMRVGLRRSPVPPS